MAIFSADALRGRVAFITGGATGIGFGIARRFSALGARVVLASRKRENLDRAVAELVENGAEAMALQVDVRDYESVAQAVQQTRDVYGALDILINNAAGNFICPTAELSPNAWRTVIDIDLNGTFHCCKAAYTALCESAFGGRIISITMVRTTRGWPGCAHASAAKAGILSLTRTLAVEWGPQGIRVNAIAPGLIGDTEGARRLVELQGRSAQEKASIPLGELGTSEDVAQVAAFLVSPAGGHISGSEIVVDGARAWSDGANR